MVLTAQVDVLLLSVLGALLQPGNELVHLRRIVIARDKAYATGPKVDGHINGTVDLLQFRLQLFRIVAGKADRGVSFPIGELEAGVVKPGACSRMLTTAHVCVEPWNPQAVFFSGSFQNVQIKLVRVNGHVGSFLQHVRVLVPRGRNDLKCLLWRVVN